MQDSFRKFIIKTALTALICYILAFIIKTFFLRINSFLAVYILIPYITLITGGFHFLLIKASKSNPTLFINKFLAFSGIKLMLYLFTIILYVIFIKSEIIIFLLSFILIYFVFTITEIISLLKFLKKS